MDTLFPYQEDMIAAMTSNNALFIAADMGLGKTRCALEASARVGAKRVLVVAPAIGRVSWPAEAEKWRPEAECLPVAAPGELLGDNSRPLYRVASYNAVSKNPEAWVKAARHWLPDAVILDEAHYLAHTGALANKRTARTTAVYGRHNDRKGSLIETARYVWPMSGTPAPNYTADLWTHLRALAPQTILSPVTRQPMSEYEFQDRFSTTRTSSYGRHVTGSVNTAQLRSSTADFFYRLRKADVLPDLPPLTWAHEPLDITALDAAAVLPVPSSVSDDELLEWLASQSDHIATQRKMLGMAKATAAISWIEDFMFGCDRKLIVFAHHPDLIDLMAKSLSQWQPVVVHGKTGETARARAVQRFQTFDGCRLFFGQTHACGEVLTLTAASDVAFVEEDWSPMKMAQAAHRALRIGQTRGVLARVLYAPGSIDERIARVVARKARDLDDMFG